MKVEMKLNSVGTPALFDHMSDGPTYVDSTNKFNRLFSAITNYDVIGVIMGVVFKKLYKLTLISHDRPALFTLRQEFGRATTFHIIVICFTSFTGILIARQVRTNLLNVVR